MQTESSEFGRTCQSENFHLRESVPNKVPVDRPVCKPALQPTATDVFTLVWLDHPQKIHANFSRQSPITNLQSGHPRANLDNFSVESSGLVSSATAEVGQCTTSHTRDDKASVSEITNANAIGLPVLSAAPTVSQ